MAGDEQVTVRDDPEQARFEVTLGGEVAGFVAYRQQDGSVALTHTEVDPAYEGKGLGSRLLEGTLSELRERGTTVLPYCSFVRSYLQRHPEWVDLVPEQQRGRFDL